MRFDIYLKYKSHKIQTLTIKIVFSINLCEVNLFILNLHKSSRFKKQINIQRVIQTDLFFFLKLRRNFLLEIKIIAMIPVLL